MAAAKSSSAHDRRVQQQAAGARRAPLAPGPAPCPRASRSRRARARRSRRPGTRAQATSKRLWLATPTRSTAAHSRRRSAESSERACSWRRRRPSVAYGAAVQPCSSASTCLHREVGALDEPHLDRRAAARARRARRPGAELARAPRASRAGTPAARCRRRAAELRLVEHAAEHGDGEVEVAVLLHVEVHERRGGSLRRPRGRAGAAGRDPRRPSRRTRATSRLAHERGDLHRDVVDVGSADALRDLASSRSVRLVVAEDRLAQQVDVEPHAVGGAARATWRANAGSSAGSTTPRVSAGCAARPSASRPSASAAPATHHRGGAADRTPPGLRSGAVARRRRSDERPVRGRRCGPPRR